MTDKLSEMLETLKKSRLCSNMSEDEMQRLLDNHHNIVKKYKRGDFVFEETDKPRCIFILLSGNVLIGRNTLAGKRMIVTQVKQAGEMFGEVYAFLERATYDMYAECLSDTEVLVIKNTVFSEVNQGCDVLLQKIQSNLLSIFATKAYTMNRKLYILGSVSIREKIVHYLFENQQKDGGIRNPLSREEMADYLNVARPSLSRELGKMQEEGIIRLENKKIAIVNQEKFETYL